MNRPKKSLENIRKSSTVKRSAAVLAVLLLTGLGVGGFLGTRSADYGPDPTRGVNVLRSQELVDGKGLKIDDGQKEKIQEEQQEKEKRQEERDVKTSVQASRAWAKAAPKQEAGADGTTDGTAGESEKEGGNGAADESGAGDGQGDGRTEDGGEEVPAEPTGEEENINPVITTDLVNGGTYASYVSFYVTAKDYKGRAISRQFMEVYVNGERVYSSGTAETKGLYDFEAAEESNTVSIKVTDREGNVSSLSITVNCDADQEQETDGTCTFIISAANIGCGYVFGPTEVTLYKGEKMSHLIARVMDEYGIAYDYAGSITSSFYLLRIYKGGITAGYSIPANILAGLTELGATSNEEIDPDSLGEKDFYQGSGWMYSYNGDVPGAAISDQTVRDGDVIEVWFTTYLGYDRDGGWDPAADM